MNDHLPLLQSPFLETLVQVIDTNDIKGMYRKLSPQEKLERLYIVSEEEIAECGQITQKVKEQISYFFQAVAFAIEQRSGIMASSMIEIDEEGFGRGIIICGNLVTLSKSIRGSQQFYFRNLKKIIKLSEKYISEALELIAKYKEVASL